MDDIDTMSRIMEDDENPHQTASIDALSILETGQILALSRHTRDKNPLPITRSVHLPTPKHRAFRKGAHCHGQWKTSHPGGCAALQPKLSLHSRTTVERNGGNANPLPNNF